MDAISAHISGKIPASLGDGVSAAHKYATEHCHTDLSSKLSAAIPPDADNKKPVYVPGTIYCRDDPSPPWAYLTDADECVQAMRSRFLVHMPRQHVTAVVEPQTGVFSKDMAIKIYTCVINRLIIYIYRLENEFFAVLGQWRWFPVNRKPRKERNLRKGARGPWHSIAKRAYMEVHLAP
jgi:hypothetical protein